jgi:IS4 transposase
MGCDYNIELFVKQIKQPLKINTLLGTSENAVMAQIGVALIASLILAFLRCRRARASRSNRCRASSTSPCSTAEI